MFCMGHFTPPYLYVLDIFDMQSAYCQVNTLSRE